MFQWVSYYNTKFRISSSQNNQISLVLLHLTILFADNLCSPGLNPTKSSRTLDSELKKVQRLYHQKVPVAEVLYGSGTRDFKARPPGQWTPPGYRPLIQTHKLNLFSPLHSCLLQVALGCWRPILPLVPQTVRGCWRTYSTPGPYKQ